MKVTFLGTGTSQGVPLIACQCEVCRSTNPKDKRLRSSILIQHEELNMVIDSGPDFRQQMLREGLRHLDAIIYTHEHKDHTAGLDDIRGFNFIMERPVDLYLSEKVENGLRQEFAYVFAEHRYPGIPEVNLNRITNAPFLVSGLQFIPIEIMHLKLPIFGFRIGDFTYITDMKSITPEEKEKVKGSKVLVVNALRREEHVSHITFDEAIAFAEEIKPEKAYFTHISHQLGLHDEVMQELPPYIELAYDGLKIDVV
jgi:phosphoribosyl 1,2-cyclic phosphate phosphodiesterase